MYDGRYTLRTGSGYRAVDERREQPPAARGIHPDRMSLAGPGAVVSRTPATGSGGPANSANGAKAARASAGVNCSIGGWPAAARVSSRVCTAGSRGKGVVWGEV